MIRAAFVAIALFAFVAEANRNLGTTQADHLNTIAGASSLLSVAGGAGFGTSGVSTFCEAFASEMTGNYFCKDSDSETGQALVAIGSPTTQVDPMCPNGPNCTSVTGFRLDGSNRYGTAPIAGPSGSFSCGAFVRPDSGGTFAVAISGGVDSFYLARSASANFWEFAIWNDAGIADVASHSSVLGSGAGQNTLVGFSYQFVGAGTSVGRIYVNGIGGTANTAMVGPMRSAAVARRIAAESGGSNALPGVYMAFFCTDKEISAATWTAMTSFLLPTVTGTKGEAITTARASVRSCCKIDGTACSNLPPNRTCFHDGAIDISGDVAQLLARSEQFEDAVWTKTNTSVTIENTLSPVGGITADLLNATVAGGCVSQAATTVIGQTYTFSAWMKAGTSTTPTLVIDTIATASPTITGAMARYSVTGVATGVSTTFKICPAGAGTGSVNAWGAQATQSAFGYAYSPSAASPTTALADTVSTPMPTGTSNTVGCMSAVVNVPGIVGTPRALRFSGAGHLRTAATSVICNDGTNTVTAAAASTPGRAVKGRCSWTGAVLAAEEVGATPASGAYDGALTGTPLYLGSDGAANYLYGLLSNVAVGATSTGCK